MKKFLSEILISAIVLLIVAIPTDFLLSQKLKNSHNHKYTVWNEISQGGMAHDVLIMGSSRAWTQISPRILDSALHISSYNLGIDGSCADRQIPRYNYYRCKNEKPQAIIQIVDWGTTLGATNGYEQNQYFPYFYDPEMRSIVISEENFPFFDLYVPLLRYIRHDGLWNSCARAFQSGEDSIVLQKGFRAFNNKWDGTILRTVDTIRFDKNSTTEQIFKNYLLGCKNDSIKMIFVYPPTYIKATQKVIGMDEIKNTFSKYAALCNAKILDYTNCFLSFDTTFFYNSSHLNRSGAEIFTKMLAHDIDSLGIINTQFQ